MRHFEAWLKVVLLRAQRPASLCRLTKLSGSELVDHNQKIAVAVKATAEKKAMGSDHSG